MGGGYGKTVSMVCVLSGGVHSQQIHIIKTTTANAFSWVLTLGLEEMPGVMSTFCLYYYSYLGIC